ncbi:MAG: leucine-rich repeat protein, partial [Ruminococcus sp.]|nr:leucine-rich repeat protein [Ruminococcus sp.]
GNMKSNQLSKNDIIKNNLKEVVIEDLDPDNGQVITNIGANLFKDCENLETVVLPATIETIDSFAFSGCTNLKSITYEGSPNKDKAIDLPPAIKKIGGHAFKGCIALECALDLSDYQYLEEIGAGAFYGTGINSLIISDNIKSLPTEISFETAQFGNCKSLTKAIINCEEGMVSNRSLSKIFDKSTGLEELTIYNVEEMLNSISTCSCGGYAPAKHLHGIFFNYYVPDSLETIILKDDEKTIIGTFGNMNNIKTIILPEELKIIEEGSFNGCTSLETVEIPETVEEIGNNAFFNCSSLKNITIPNHVKIIPFQCFENCISLESIDIPKSIVELGKHAFENCTSLKTISIPNTVETIPSRCFTGCSSLETFVFPEGVTKMEGNPTDGKWNSLKEIYIPRSLQTIANYTFGVVINDTFSNEGKVYYGGTEEEWEALKKKQSVKSSNSYYTSEFNFNDSIFNANVIFNAKPEDMSSYVASQEEFVPSGDVNGNGKLDLGDALAILQYIANSSKYPLSEEAIKQADVYNTGDGITPMDALAIQQYDAGLIDSLPVYR